MLQSQRCGLLGIAVIAARAIAGDYKVPRLADGAPDLQGVWTNATATPVERSPELGERRAFTEQEAAAIGKAAIAAVEADAAPSDPNKKIEAASLAAAGRQLQPVLDRSRHERREHRRRVPHVDDHRAAERAHSAAHARRLSNASPRRASGRRRTTVRKDAALGERCLLSFGSASGPPMLPVMYNSYYQIVQSPGYVMILVEMVHDARIIRIGDAARAGRAIRSGWATRSVTGKATRWWSRRATSVPSRPSAARRENMVVTERFTRVAERQDRLSLHRR